MGTKYWKDDKGDLEKIFKPLIEKHFPNLTQAQFIYTYHDKPTFDDEGEPIAAFARKIPNKERDIYGPDFEISVFQEYWITLSDKQKRRLAYHELLHPRIEMEDEDSDTPALDDNGRLITWIEPHDLVIKTFKQEIEVFGLSKGDVKVAEFLSNALATYYEKKAEKRSRKDKDE
jgi:hypothetical protein